MTHEELLGKLLKETNKDCDCTKTNTHLSALCAVVELHKPEHSQSGYRCTICFIDTTYPCTTIQAITKELQ